MNKPNSKRQESFSAKEYFEVYWRHSSSLRNWFIAYGIGGCILFISDKAKIFQQLSSSVKAAVVIIFLLGVGAQVFLAFVNKCIHWCIYWGDENEGFKNNKWYKWAEKWSPCFLIDVWIDVFTGVMFLIATIIAICSIS